MKKTNLLLLAFCLTVGTQAQQNKNTTPALTANADVLAAENAIRTYHFEEAAELLEEAISTARRKQLDATPLQAILQQANCGMDMMNGIEKVVFVDSIVINKTQLLSAYRLSTDIGTISSTQNLPQNLKSGKVGMTFFKNDLDDLILYAAPDANGRLKIHRADRIDDQWVNASSLNGLTERNGQQDYPFMLSDGTTLYFAENGEESLGGYDLFVTRYSSSSHEYLKPENLGMPFNSPYNDYMLVIDEPNNLGWFASDRYQPEGKVCVYLFVPNDTKDIYLAEAMSEEELNSVARFAAASFTPANQPLRQAALTRLQGVSSSVTQDKNRFVTRCILDNRHAYASISDFKVPQAAKLAATWNEKVKSLQQMRQTLDKLRQQYAKATPEQAGQLSGSILKMEKSVAQLTTENAQLLNQIRKLEVGESKR